MTEPLDPPEPDFASLVAGIKEAAERWGERGAQAFSAAFKARVAAMKPYRGYDQQD